MSYSISEGREKWVHKSPQKYFEDMVSFALITSNRNPSSYRNVEEMGSLQKNKTWESVKLPKGKRLFVASVYTARKKHYQKMKMQNSKHN